MKPISTLLLLICFATGTSFMLPDHKRVNDAPATDQPANIADTFPIPPAKSNMMFYVQRTHNINTIVYELNYNADSTLSETEPIHIYWIRYADDGSTRELSYLQKKYAYGLTCICIDKARQIFKVNFVSYKKRDIFLMKHKTAKSFQACMNINNRLAYLDKIFVKIDGGTFWLPHITYVEVAGKDIGSGKAISERIIP